MHSHIMLIIAGMAAVTYATRTGGLVIVKQAARARGGNAWLERWLKYLPVAMLTALIVPALLVPRGYLDISVHNHYLIAGIAAALVSLRGLGVIPTMGVGMLCMLLLKFIA